MILMVEKDVALEDDYVTKRNGDHELFYVEKIRRCINWACEGFDVNPLELESKIDTFFYKGIKTEDIHANTIEKAISLTSLDFPDWRYVAGRLAYQALQKEVYHSRPYKFGRLYEHIRTMVVNRLYTSELLNLFSKEDIDYLSKFLRIERDWDYDYTGIATLKKRYLLKGELPQEMYMVLAMLIGSESKKIDLKEIVEIYDAISLKKLSLATPILANLRKPGKVSLSSCFITQMDDSLDSIFQTITDIAQISKKGGGVGCNVSRVRATGAPVQGRENSSGGVIPWIKIVNETINAVDQGGRRVA